MTFSPWVQRAGGITWCARPAPKDGWQPAVRVAPPRASSGQTLLLPHRLLLATGLSRPGDLAGIALAGEVRSAESASTNTRLSHDLRDQLTSERKTSFLFGY